MGATHGRHEHESIEKNLISFLDARLDENLVAAYSMSASSAALDKEPHTSLSEREKSTKRYASAGFFAFNREEMVAFIAWTKWAKPCCEESRLAESRPLVVVVVG